MVGNMRKRKKGKKKDKKAEAFAMVMKNVLKQPEKNAQVKRDGLAITVERRGTSSGIALRHVSRLRHLSHPGSMSGLQRTTLEERLPSEAEDSGVGLSRKSRLKVPRGPHTSSHPKYT